MEVEVQSKGTDGLIFINTRLCTPSDIQASIQELHGAQVPFVMINGAQDQEGINYVGVDERQLGATAAEYLAAQGHRHIAILNGPRSSPTTRMMLQSFRQTLKQKKLPFLPAWNPFGNYQREETRKAIRQLAGLRERPTGQSIRCITTSPMT
ncbi:MAG: substrate-binding domain-containing protein [Bryobacteraceae bacterium]|nr:substrate-binding domain-containing protein [Bryobacteraceae bacterium]